MYENITYESILQRMLDRIPDDMDKSEGAVIYDALAPAAVELQLMYIELDTFSEIHSHPRLRTGTVWYFVPQREESLREMLQQRW